MECGDCGCKWHPEIDNAECPNAHREGWIHDWSTPREKALAGKVVAFGQQIRELLGLLEQTRKPQFHHDPDFRNRTNRQIAAAIAEHRGD